MTKKSKLGVRALGLSALMLVASGAQAANLATNGSFEEGTFVGGSYGYPLAQQVASGDSTTLPGWTTASSELAWFRSGQAGITTVAGDKALDLTGFSDAQGSYASVSQIIATQIGATYRLTFLGGTYLYNGGTAAAGIRASAGATSQDFFFPPTGLASGVWDSYGFDFVASSTFTTLSFLGLNGPDTDPPYIGLDDVSVEFLKGPESAVPEPASWAMLTLGFGAMGAAMRRRSMRVCYT